MVCPLQPCGACVGLATKPTPQNFLHLIHRRHYIKSNLNFWHDHLAARLPVEIVSRIFVIFDHVNENQNIEPGKFNLLNRRRWDHFLRTPALLSRVCRRWRNIVLTTPQLWTRFFIEVRIQARPEKLELLKEFLTRSGSLPLSLVLWGIDTDEKVVPYRLDPLVDVIRSYSSRWKLLDIESAPPELAEKLLHDVDDISPSVLECLRLNHFSLLEQIHCREPLRPKYLSILRMENIAQVPLEWDNITRLEMSEIHISTLLYFVKKTPRLTHWRSERISINPSGQEHPLPEDVIVNPILSHLELSFKENNILFFHHLTLPGLTHLRCHFGIELYENDGDLDLEDLLNFLARSQLDSKSLQTLDLKYNLITINYDLRFRELNAITHARICIMDERDTIINTYLSAMYDISIFPLLRKFELEAWNVPSSAWAMLCDLFREKPLLADDGSIAPSDGVCQCPPRRFHRRPLEYVSMEVYSDEIPDIPREDYFFLRSIQKAGQVKLDFNIFRFRFQRLEVEDILQTMSKIHGDLP